MPLTPDSATPEEIARGLALLDKQRERAKARYYANHDENKKRQLEYYYAHHEERKTKNREAARRRVALFKASQEVVAPSDGPDPIRS